MSFSKQPHNGTYNTVSHLIGVAWINLFEYNKLYIYFLSRKMDFNDIINFLHPIGNGTITNGIP